MSLGISLKSEPVRSLGFASVGAVYAGIGTSLSRPARIFMIQNLLNTDVMISFNGIEDHFPLPTSGFVLMDVSSNQSNMQGFYIAEGTRFYVKQLTGAATQGSIYLTVFYGE